MEGRYVLVMFLLFTCGTAFRQGVKEIDYGYLSKGKCICGTPAKYTGGDGIPRPFYELFPGLGFYKLHTNPKTWHEAKIICEREGAHLAVINSKEEIEAMRELRRRLPTVFGTWEDDHCFIGIDDIQHEGAWRTVTDTTLNEAGFAEWYKGEPNGGTKENCGIVIVADGKLNDASCTSRRGFFCEAEQ